jgi:hypothetical protein
LCWMQIQPDTDDGVCWQHCRRFMSSQHSCVAASCVTVLRHVKPTKGQVCSGSKERFGAGASRVAFGLHGVPRPHWIGFCCNLRHNVDGCTSGGQRRARLYRPAKAFGEQASRLASQGAY